MNGGDQQRTVLKSVRVRMFGVTEKKNKFKFHTARERLYLPFVVHGQHRQGQEYHACATYRLVVWLIDMI